MLAGMFRFTCSNGLVCGEAIADVRVHHKGQIVDRVIEGAYEVLDGFDLVRKRRDDMRAVTLAPAEADIVARAALALKYESDPVRLAPITESQVLAARRVDDTRPDLWSMFNRAGKPHSWWLTRSNRQ